MDANPALWTIRIFQKSAVMVVVTRNTTLLCTIIVLSAQISFQIANLVENLTSTTTVA